MIDAAQVAAVRRRLKKSWSPFFSRFGRLTPVQLAAIPPILDGKNVVVASPTASGKTEAVVAPLAELFCAEQWEELAVLYIAPTRALANDLLMRIEGPLEDLGIRTSLKHGDRPYLGRNLPNFLITTPESLDSLICRHAELLATVRAVVLDEIHLLDSTHRGDQLRVLLRRLLRLVSAGRLSVHILSATLSEPHQIAARYAEDFEVITVPGRREIEYTFINSPQEAYRLARQNGHKKLLYFCNLRESVETVAAELGPIWHPYPVVAHHGSLDRDVREEAEEVMKGSDVAVCVATSTLEIGIDIGNIDLVVLAEVPWSISSLLQRIGRGNRRKNKLQVAAVVTSEAEQSLLEAMFQAAIAGAIPVEPYSPDLSVAIQQIFSCLYQYPQGLPEPDLADLLSVLCSSAETQLILAHLRRRDWIEWRAGHWCASTKLMDLGEKGRIHSNIPDPQSYRVIDIDSGKQVGKIAGVFDKVFALGQSSWEVVSVAGDTINVRRLRHKAAAPMFQRRGSASAFYHLLPVEQKNR